MQVELTEQPLVPNGPKPEDYPIFERDIASQLGVKLESICDLRHKQFKHGEDWVRFARNPTKAVPGVGVYYTLQAAQRMAGLFLPGVVIVFFIPEIQEVTVIKSDFRNKRIISVHGANGNGAGPVLVKVNDSTNFVPGMKIKVRKKLTDHMGILVGRCPRFRGKF